MALPLVVGGAVGAGEGLGAAGGDGERDGLGLGARVVGAADGNGGAEVVDDLDVDGGGALFAELGGEGGVGEVELAVGAALQAADGLAGQALQGGPLRLLVAVRAGVGAEGAGGAGATGDDVVVAAGVGTGRGLDADPAANAHPRDVEGAVGRGEVAAVELAVGEVGVDTDAREPRGGRRGRGVLVESVGLGCGLCWGDWGGLAAGRGRR